jgi:hypothetical protein
MAELHLPGWLRLCGLVAALSSVNAAGAMRSITDWAVADGVTDDRNAVAQAFAAAKNDSFVLAVDCPVKIHIGNDIARPIFIDSGTTVEFAGNGEFIVDNAGIPAFVIANSSNVTLRNAVIQYVGALPLTQGLAGTFSDVTLKSWLTVNRSVTYTSQNPYWNGPTDLSAIFVIVGNSSHIAVDSMRAFVPASSGGDRFIPMLFASLMGEKTGATVTRTTPVTPACFAIPSYLSFTSIDIDGSYFGWQGSMRNAVFSHIVSHRYGDLQDSTGGTVGGVNTWFAPPHLMYLNYSATGDTAFFNSNIQITDVMDYGVRVGAGRVTTSGNCYSLKLGTIGGLVDGYASYRPDGFMDVLPSTNLTIQNVIVGYNSTFLNSAYAAIRWPSSGYHNITFDRLIVTDSAASTALPPIWGSNQSTNTNIAFSDAAVRVNAWTGTQNPAAVAFAGTGNSISIQPVCASGCVSAVDAAPPSTPAGLSGSALSGSAIALTWTASTDNSFVAGYKVFRNAIQVGLSGTTSYTNTGLLPNTTYSYTVSAYDAVGNTSPPGSAASVTTAHAPSPPSCAATANPAPAPAGSRVHIAVYVSLSRDNLRISVPSGTMIGDASVDIYDIAGKKVKAVPIAGLGAAEGQVRLPDGCYLYSVVDGGKRIADGKMVVE